MQKNSILGIALLGGILLYLSSKKTPAVLGQTIPTNETVTPGTTIVLPHGETVTVKEPNTNVGRRIQLNTGQYATITEENVYTDGRSSYWRAITDTGGSFTLYDGEFRYV